MPRKTRNCNSDTGTSAVVDQTELDAEEFNAEEQSGADWAGDCDSASSCGLDAKGTSEGGGDTVEAAVEFNTRLLQQLLAKVTQLHGVIASTGAGNEDPGSASEDEESNVDMIANWLEPEANERRKQREEQDLQRRQKQAELLREHEEANNQLRQRLDELLSQVGDLKQQNSDLASQLATTSVDKVVVNGDGGSDTLSWEDRKQLILQQMEDDSFDADAFAAEVNAGSGDCPQSPSEYVDHLSDEIARRDEELRRRDDEISELKFLLDQQSESRQHEGVAFGAAAIAEIMDADELVKEERERLRLLQAEWQEKFREGEIEASLERAKLSRERQELAKKQAELEEQLEHARRESRQSDPGEPASSRRWLAKLGLSDES